MIDRLPPHDTEAERAVLSGIMVDNGLFPRIAEMVSAADFYHEAHRKLFGLMVELHPAPIDPVTLASKAESAGSLAAVGGPAGIAALLDVPSVSAHAPHHATVIREKARLRLLSQAFADGVESIHSRNGAGPGHALDKILLAGADVVHLMNELIDGPAGGFVLEPLRLADYDSTTRPAAIVGDPEGDVLLPAGDLIIVAAEAGTGKTLFALDLAIACVTGGEVLGFRCQKGRALVIAADGDGASVILRRTARLALGRKLVLADLDTDSLFVTVPDALCLDVPQQLAAVKATVKRLDPDLVVLDSLNILPGQGVDLKDSQPALQFMRSRIRPLQERPDGSRRTIILLHHLRKHSGQQGGNHLRDRVGGSYSLVAGVDAVIGLESGGPGTFTAKIVKPSRTGARFASFLARIEGGPAEPLRLVNAGTIVQKAAERIADDQALVDALTVLAGPDGWVRSDAVKERLSATTEAKVRAFNRTVNRAVKAGAVERHPTKKALVRLAPAPAAPEEEPES